MALVPIPQLPHIQPPTTYVDPEQIIALYTPKQHPGRAELILNLRGADGKVRSVFADLTVAAAVIAYGPFIPVELLRITDDVPTDYHVRASAIVELAPRPDGNANLWLSNGECKAITPVAYAALVNALAGPAVAAAGQV
ncbi:hypothetical protein [Burkholderia contaminans]|uniref:hypothetical protein n=1 Tax=Burkholderia contaminans TaxID=488447 RepID=UPI003D666D3D